MFIGKAPCVGCGVARRAEGVAVLLCLSGGRVENLRGKIERLDGAKTPLLPEIYDFMGD